MTAGVTVERDTEGLVVWVRFDGGHKANVLTLDMVQALRGAVGALHADPPRVMVIAGTDTAFSAGADLATLRVMSEATYVEYLETEYELFRLVETLPAVTIAMLAGPCLGNAAELTLACDLRVAADDVRFGLPEMSVGFIAPTQRLARYVGYGTAKDLVLRRRLLSGAAAAELGLVTHVAPPGELVAETARIAAECATLSPLALRHTKASLELVYGGYAPEQDERERRTALETFRSQAFRDAADALLQRRR